MTVFSKTTALLTAVIAAVILCSSCGSDETSSTSTAISSNCAITRMVLGNIPRTIYTKTSAGNDTSYVSTVAGSAYAMYIDQIKQEIYNHDSLPANTMVNKVVFSSVSNDGTLAYQTKSGKDTLFSTTDTLDFTSPRYFTCFSSDGTQSRKYLVRVNVHNSDPDNYSWTELMQQSAAFSGVTLQKMFACDSSLVILALRDGAPVRLKASKNAPAEFESSTVTGLESLVPAEVYQFGDKLYYADNGTLKSSTDGLTWQSAATGQSIDRLIAVSESGVYALSSSKIYYSEDMATWTLEETTDDMALFPQSDIASACSPMSFNDNFYSILVCGKNSSGDNVIWKKLVDRKGVNTEAWTIYPQGSDSKNVYPDKNQPLLFSYNSQIFHFGLTAEGDASEITVSTDGGRCWLPLATTKDPSLNGGAASFSALCDSDNYIWIATAPCGQLVRGRLNRLSYANDPTVFSKAIR